MTAEPELQAPVLAAALEAQDAAAVAFALRNDVAVIPLVTDAAAMDVRLFPVPGSDRRALLLFSSSVAYSRMLPRETGLAATLIRRPYLIEILETRLDELAFVWFDLAGPHPMQADPLELLTALTLIGTDADQY